MIDRNNLNRIKGILSARAGAEIPKFDPGGSIPQYNHNDPDFVNFINLTKARHNPITWLFTAMIIFLGFGILK